MDLIGIYLSLPPYMHRGYKCVLVPVNDVLPLDELKDCVKLYEDEEKVIVLARVAQVTVDAFKDETGSEITAETATAMGIGDFYLGKTYESIFERYPELAGTKTIVTEDGDIEVPIVANKRWAE